MTDTRRPRRLHPRADAVHVLGLLALGLSVVLIGPYGTEVGSSLGSYAFHVPVVAVALLASMSRRLRLASFVVGSVSIGSLAAIWVPLSPNGSWDRLASAQPWAAGLGALLVLWAIAIVRSERRTRPDPRERAG